MEPSSLSPSGAALPLPLSLAQPPLPAAAVVHVSFPEVTSALLESLNQQRLQGQLCDVSIRVQGREFRAHRAVLAASSPYFHDQVLLKGMTSISLPSVMDPGAFETVLASAYTGRLSMAAADIVNFLTVGSVLQMWHIVDKCTELLREGRASATISTSTAPSATVPGSGAPAGSGGTVAPTPVGSVRSHASSQASENQSPSSSNYFSPRESTDFSSSSQEAFAASAGGSGERRGGGTVFPAPVVGSGGATSGKLLLEADELCDDGGDGRGAVVPGTGHHRRPSYAPPSIMPQKHWVYVKQGGNCPAPAPLVPQDPDLEEEEEEEDLVLTCEDDEDEELGGGSGVPAGGGPEATLSISDVRTLTEPPDKGEEQVNFCESSNDFGPYEGGGPGAGLDDSGGPTTSSYTPSHPPRPLLPLDMQGSQILVFPSSSQASGQPPGNQAEHGAVTLGGTSSGGLGVPGSTSGASGGTGGGDGNKIFLCHCGKAFSHKSMRDRHVNMHLNLRPFDCPVCNKKFKMKHHLTEHMKTHTGLKPYECSVCAKKFMWRDSFMRHRGHCERWHRLGGAGPGPPTGSVVQPKRESHGAGGGSGDETSGATPPPSPRVWSPTSVHKVEMGFNGGGGAN
ncbi:PREDICTED: zinc finger and BTB domain-containing protein 22 [Chrysochloris asiatica]|uniref:Zinc finger and BTB domain-containing protein 22 n=1 Tax=Chrysochloris asiatica TaxID=185453 RepID=A0A9B0TAE9_CHRAS|nr:PREDICTED: zinc finger and BTB domain-containing protein 22 [Chrysochloris asiatica]